MLLTIKLAWSTRIADRTTSQSYDHSYIRLTNGFRRSLDIPNLVEWCACLAKLVANQKLTPHGRFRQSPYNANNPYYGYPATRYADMPSGSDETDPIRLPHARPFHLRRRKRDLMRTLSYLAALRIVALHRKIKWRLTLFWKIMWDALVRWGAVARHPGRSWSWSARPVVPPDEEDDSPNTSPRKRKRHSVHWAADDPRRQSWQEVAVKRIRALSPLPVLRGMPRLVYLLAALVFLRSVFFQRRARRFVDAWKEYLLELLEKYSSRKYLALYLEASTMVG